MEKLLVTRMAFKYDPSRSQGSNTQTLQHLKSNLNCDCLWERRREKRANTTWASLMINTSDASLSLTSMLITRVLLHGSGLYSMLSSMSLPAKTASVPMMHTAMNTQSRMWSKTMATNFHSSAACNKMRWGSKEVMFEDPWLHNMDN